MKSASPIHHIYQTQKFFMGPDKRNVLSADVAMVTTTFKHNTTVMALSTIHTIATVQKFQSAILSRAFLFAISCDLLTVVLPLVIAYSSNAFWVKHAVKYEHPKVLFNHQAILIAHGRDSSVTWSTFEKYNSLVADTLRYPIVISDEIDVNDDGTSDGLQFELHLDDSHGIQSVQLLLMFSFQLKEITEINMESLAVFHYNSGLPLAELHCTADLEWVQRRLVPFQGREDNRYNASLINRFEISEILEAYNAREYTTEIRNEHYSPIFGSQTGSLKIKASIRYKQAVVEYIPEFWNLLKWGWIQYASLLFVFIYLNGKVKDFIFSNQIIPTWDENQFKLTYK